MSVFQIWGSFTKDEPEFPTTVSTFRKDQRAPNGALMVDLEREFSDEEGEELVLLHEFDVIQALTDRGVDEHMPSPEMEAAIAYITSNAFMEGWFRRRDEDDADDQDEP